MSKESENKNLVPSDEILALLGNSLELAVSQKLKEARDALRASRIIAQSFSLDDVVFDQLDDAIMSKPWYVLQEEFNRAARVIKRKVMERD